MRAKKQEKPTIVSFSAFQFYEQLKFYAQFSCAQKKFYDIGA